MISLNKEMAFVNLYLTEKEYFMPDLLREALSKIYYLINTKKIDKALAIYFINNKYIKKHNINYTKEYLTSKYNSRSAHIKNGKEIYKTWSLELRENKYGCKIKLCECGCGEEVTKKKNRFVNGHNIKSRSKEETINLAAKMRSIKKLKKSNNIILFKKHINK